MPEPLDLRGQSVLVVGLARSGTAAARLCASRGARVKATDRRAATELGPLSALESAGVELALGGHDVADFTGADLVVVSPGVPLSLPEIAEARRQGVPVLGEVELGWRLLRRPVPAVGVTGTNGKSTTTALAGVLFQQDRRAFAGGNLGTPLCELLLQGRDVDVLVLELSSFQIEGLELFRPAVAACLNLTPDHLDRYRDLGDYAAAKARLFMNQQAGDFAVANARDPRSLAMASTSRGQLFTFGFGDPEPRSARDPSGQGEVLLRLPAGEERYALRNRALRGRHNRENAMAAVLCARLLGVPGSRVQAGLDEFRGLPHRLEVGREHGGVEWVNDSKATNVDSTQVGLAAFPASGPRVILVMGGRGKGAPYTGLRPLFPDRVKALFTIGEDAPAVERDLGDLVPTERAGTLSAAVARAAAAASPGDAVLLSPACASYDQFRNYEERGETFRQLVMELPG